MRLAVIGIIASACSEPPLEEARLRAGGAAWDVRPITVSAFATDPAVTTHVLRMPFGEAAARLGALQFEAKSSFEFSRGGESYDQADTYDVRQDAGGNFRVHMTTTLGEVEFYLVGENVYVRQNKGQLRKKLRRDVETDGWCEIAFSSLHQALDLFRPRLAFSDNRPENVGSRPAVRWRVALADSASSSQHVPPESEPLLPVGPPVKWRELAQPLDLKGDIWIDSATGVVLKSKLQGRIEVADRDVRPTQLTVTYQSEIKKVGDATPIKAPEHVPEYERTPPPRDVLSFFRDQLPPPEPAKRP